MMADIAEAIKTETREKIKSEEPGMYDVLFLNDDVTTVEFVVKVLKQIFNKTQEEAIKITEAIHSNGQGIVGTYLFEIAEQKGIETTLLAREEGYPLQVKVQKQK
jgi:ATP-dependent Clp protease adaptor protein ClpS